MAEFITAHGGLTGKSARDQEMLARVFVRNIERTNNKFIQGFNSAVGKGPQGVRAWFDKTGKNIPLKATGQLPHARGAKIRTGISKSLKIGGKVIKGAPIIAGVVTFGTSIASGKSIDDAQIDVVMSVTGADILDDISNAIARPAVEAIGKRQKNIDYINEWEEDHN